MDTKGSSSPSSQGHCYFLVILDAFSHLVLTNSVPHYSSKSAIQNSSIIGLRLIIKTLPNLFTNFGAPQYLVIYRGTEYIIRDMVHRALSLVLITLHVIHILLGQMV